MKVPQTGPQIKAHKTNGAIEKEIEPALGQVRPGISLLTTMKTIDKASIIELITKRLSSFFSLVLELITCSMFSPFIRKKPC